MESAPAAPGATPTLPEAVVLVVEDDPTINSALVARLEAEGFRVVTAHDGPSGVDAAARCRPDLVVLDVMLPGFDGLEVCRRIQAARPVPVLMLTARDEETDVLVGLGVGADDYLTKPFRMREVVARVRALLRRVERAAAMLGDQPADGASPSARVEVGSLAIDVATRVVTVAGEAVHLTPTEFELLGVLAERAGEVLRREELLRRVWGWDEPWGSRTLDSHVRAVRAKIGAERIRTVHGVGYALEGVA